jgi:hypothetical protein
MMTDSERPAETAFYKEINPRSTAVETFTARFNRVQPPSSRLGACREACAEALTVAGAGLASCRSRG